VRVAKFYKVERVGDGHTKVRVLTARFGARQGVASIEQAMARRGYNSRRPFPPHHYAEQRPGYVQPSQAALRRARHDERTEGGVMDKTGGPAFPSAPSLLESSSRRSPKRRKCARKGEQKRDGISVNKVILVGNLGRDPETKYMPNGDAVPTSRSPRPTNGRTRRAATRRKKPSGTASRSSAAWPRSSAST
jgi:hypothetical protein